jgi:hypothetical protein
MINEQSGMKLLDYFGYDYKLTAIVLLLIELSEGPEARDRLLEGILSPQVRRNVEHVADQLRDALGMIGSTPTDPPHSSKNPQGSPRKAIA